MVTAMSSTHPRLALVLSGGGARAAYQIGFLSFLAAEFPDVSPPILTGEIGVEHVMASAALPLFFPAIQLDHGWYGDGGVRLTAPLSPAVHLGADRILAISTRYGRTREEADRPAVDGYPPPAQVAGVLLNAIFLDLFDGDALRLQRINDLVDRLPEDQRAGMRHVDLLVLRPSLDLGRLASEYEADMPRPAALSPRVRLSWLP